MTERVRANQQTTDDDNNSKRWKFSSLFRLLYQFNINLYTVKTDEDCYIVSKMLFILFVLDSSKKEVKNLKSFRQVYKLESVNKSASIGFENKALVDIWIELIAYNKYWTCWAANVVVE